MPIQNVGNDIVSAYLSGRQFLQQKQQQEVENQQKQQNLELEKQKIEQQGQMAQAEHELNQKHLDLQKSISDLTNLKAKAQIGKQVSEEGPDILPFIGAKLTGTTYDETGQYPKTISFEHPMFGDVTVEHPLARASRIAEQSRILGAPAEEARTREEAAKQEAETRRQLQTIQLKDRLDSVEKQAANAAAQKRAETAANARIEAAKLHVNNDKSVNAINNISNKFSSEGSVKDYNTTKEAYDFAKSIDPTSKFGSDDTALMYAYVKAQNPSSSREPAGDVKAAEASATDLASKFGFAVDRLQSHAPFLKEDARRAVVNSIKERYDSQLKNYTNMRSEYGKRIKNLGQNPEDYLIDHTKGFENLSTPSEATHVYNPTTGKAEPVKAGGKK